MPATAETSSLRRLLMQSIMWLILAATIGLAALVDSRKGHAAITLGPPQRIEDFSLRWPVGWESESNAADTTNAMLAVREPLDGPDARLLSVEIDRASLSDFVRSLGRSSHSGVGRISTLGITFGDQPATLQISREQLELTSGDSYETEQMTVSRPLDARRTLHLTLTHMGVDDRIEQERDVELVKKVAATLVTNLK